MDFFLGEMTRPHRDDAPPDGDSLARRAMRDFSPIVDALWGAGYYDANPARATHRQTATETTAEPAMLAEVDRMLGLADEVIRHKVLRVPESVYGPPKLAGAPAAES